MDLNLVVGSETIDSVHMSLTSSALPASIEKDINTTKVTGAVKAFAGLLPVGSYSVAFSATTASGKPCTGSAGPFNVTANVTTEVSVSVVCGVDQTGKPARGSAAITATITNAVSCPYLTEVIVAPTELEAGGVIDLSAKVSDTTGIFAWSASPSTGGGTFGSTSALATTFTASSAGSYTLTATLDKAGCTQDTIGTGVTFTPVGNGSGGAPGSGGAGGAGGAESGGAGGAGGSESGGAGGAGGSESGGAGGLASGGAGGSESGGAGGGGGTPPAFSYCESTADEIQPATCTECEQAQCDAPVAPGCDSFAAGSAEREQCVSVLSCLRQTNCIGLGALNCFCGPNVDIVACKASLSNAVGVCKNEIIAGYPAGSTAGFIVDNSTRVDIPGAAALALGQCDFAFCGPPGNGGFEECVPYCRQ